MTKVTSSMAFKWLDGQSAFHSLLKSIERKQKDAYPSDRYVEPFAWFGLMRAIAVGLLAFANTTNIGPCREINRPRQARPHRKAIAALASLRICAETRRACVADNSMAMQMNRSNFGRSSEST